MDWYTLLREFAQSVGLAAIVIFLGKQIIERLFNKDLEKFKSELQKEVLRSNVQFQQLHTDRAEVIKNVYKTIVDTRDAFVSLLNPLQMAGELKEEDKAKMAANAANEFIRYYSRNKIFFDSELAGKVDVLRDKLFEIWRNYQIRQYSEPGDNVRIESYRKTWDGISKDVPEILKSIENEFRQLIGL